MFFKIIMDEEVVELILLKMFLVFVFYSMVHFLYVLGLHF